MIALRTLEQTSLPQLHEAFLAAFADYQVPMNLDANRLQAMLLRNGYRGELSMGAFDGEALVGFVLNGVRDWNGHRTAYDSGTAVLPAYRRQGISSALFAELYPLLSAAGISRYLLEVIVGNSGAVRLYQQMGFQATREFICLGGSAQKRAIDRAAAYSPTFHDQGASLPWDALRDLWDIAPSWQNSFASAVALPGITAALTIREANRIIAYALFVPDSGSIRQLAVHPQHRGRGVGQVLWNALVDRCQVPQLSITNVDARGEELLGFLHTQGLRETVRQYEMVKDISAVDDAGERV